MVLSRCCADTASLILNLELSKRHRNQATLFPKRALGNLATEFVEERRLHWKIIYEVC